MDSKDKHLFKGLRFCFYGFGAMEALQLKNFVKTYEGLVDYILNEKTNFYVVSDTIFEEKGEKVTAALMKKVFVVKKNFINDCVENNILLDSKSYATYNSFEEERSKRPLDSAEEPEPKKKRMNEPQTEDKKVKRKRQKPLKGKWRTARVFISSTFRDMHGERDYLTRYVFPELQERCQKLNVHVIPVDLRWGVTSEDTINALELCLTELDSCRPFFIGLIGNRYGWVPEKYSVPDEAKYAWIKMLPPGRSITHLEMEYGSLREPEKAKAAFYIRDNGFVNDVTPLHKADFMEENAICGVALEDLKERIRSIMPPETVFDNYPCSWKGVVDDKPMVGNLEAFGSHVLELFWRYMQEEFKVEETEFDPLETERNYHERFIESHSSLFVGRQTLLNNIRDFVKNTTTHPLVIVGQPGAGKTSLVSYFANSLVKETRPKEKEEMTFVLPHFVGAAPGSTSIRSSLTRIVKEIVRFFEIEVEKVPEDYKELQTTFKDILTKVGAIPNSKLVLILDALNQLDSTNHSHSLDWLPETVPANVRLIVSTLPGEVHDVLKRRQHEELPVGPLSRNEQIEIVRQTLWQYRKKLDDTQMNLLIQKTDAMKPLYLIVACEELRVFGVFEKVKERIQQMAETVPTLFEEVLRRLEKDHDKELMIKTLALLACSREGLLESEMLVLLGSNNEPLPRSTWATIYRSLKNYLRPPGESGEGVLDFFHQQLPKAVKRLYLSDKNYEIGIHTLLADYFWILADPDKDGTWDTGNKRGLNFVAYHQIVSKQWSNLKHNLCNLGFIESKCEAGMTYDLVADYLFLQDQSDSSIPSDIASDIEEYQRFVMGRAHVLMYNPSLTFSMAYSLPNSSSPAQQAHKRYYVTGAETRPFIKWMNKPQTANPCIMTLSGHDMVVKSCSVCPNKEVKKIVAASDDNTLKIYDATTGEELSTLRGHTNSLVYCCYSTKGDFIVSVGYDKVVRVWNTETNLIQRELKGHKAVITGCDVHPNNKTIATCSRDKTVKIWEENNLLISIDAHEKAILACAFSPDGKKLATCSEDGTIKIWDTNSWVSTTTLSSHTRFVNSVVWKKDSQHLLTASDDRTVILWKVDGTVVKKFAAHKDGATYAVFNAAEDRVVSCSHDNIIYVWNLSDPEPEPISMLIGHTGSVFKIEFSPFDPKLLISCSFDRTVKVWEVREEVDVKGHEARILSLAFSPDGKKIASGSRDKTIKIWDSLTGKELLHLKGHQSNVFGVCWSPNGKLLCSAGRDKILIVWNADNGSVVTRLVDHKDSVRCCAWSPDGEHIVSAADDKTLIVWDARTYIPISKLYGHRAEIIFCAYSMDGRRLASCSDDRTIKIWDTKKGKMNYGTSYVKVGTYIHHTKGVKCVGFSPDNKSLVSGAEDNLLIEWNARNAKIQSILEGHTEAIRGCGYTKDGRWILSGATDSTVRLWNTKTKQVDCMFASLSRLCAVDATIVAFQHVFAVGDGSGQIYLLTPVGIEKNTEQFLDKNEE